jgi:hypothetical protein
LPGANSPDKEHIASDRSAVCILQRLAALGDAPVDFAALHAV